MQLREHSVAVFLFLVQKTRALRPLLMKPDTRHTQVENSLGQESRGEVLELAAFPAEHPEMDHVD